MQEKVPVPEAAAPATVIWPLKLQDFPPEMMTPNAISPSVVIVPVPLAGSVTLTVPPEIVAVTEPDTE